MRSERPPDSITGAGARPRQELHAAAASMNGTNQPPRRVVVASPKERSKWVIIYERGALKWVIIYERGPLKWVIIYERDGARSGGHRAPWGLSPHKRERLARAVARAASPRAQRGPGTIRIDLQQDALILG